MGVPDTEEQTNFSKSSLFSLQPRPGQDRTNLSDGRIPAHAGRNLIIWQRFASTT